VGDKPKRRTDDGKTKKGTGSKGNRTLRNRMKTAQRAVEGTYKKRMDNNGAESIKRNYGERRISGREEKR